MRLKRIQSGAFAGPNNGRWKGGRYTNKGYVFVRIGVGKYRLEHLVVAEQKLGRALKRGEVVHHVNMDTTDNRPENLTICSQLAHMRIHFEYGCVLSRLLKHEELVAINERIVNEVDLRKIDVR